MTEIITREKKSEAKAAICKMLVSLKGTICDRDVNKTAAAPLQYKTNTNQNLLSLLHGTSSRQQSLC